MNYPKFLFIAFLILLLMGIIVYFLRETFGYNAASVIILVISVICAYILKDENKKLRDVIGIIIFITGSGIVGLNEDKEFNIIPALCGILTALSGAYLFFHKGRDNSNENN